MRKAEVVESVVTATDLPERRAEAAVSAVFEQITNALSRGETVNLVGFGSFAVKQRAARRGRNPQTGDSLAIPASRYPVFKPGQRFKDQLSLSEYRKPVS